MARMHSRKRGRAGSKKPLIKTPKPWISYSPQEIEQLIVKIAKTGKSQSQIGIILRDSYGIPDIKAITNKTVAKVLREHKQLSELPEDLANLIKKEIKLTKHLDRNKQDKVSKRGLQLTEAKINRLAKYYKRNGVLPKDWKYSREQANITV